MTDLERTNAELRAALIVAGKRIVKLNFGRRNDPVLTILRRVLRESRQGARARKAAEASGSRHVATMCVMPITIFDVKGVPGHRSERIEAAVVAAGEHVSGPHEAWIAADPFQGGFKVLITGANGFERTVTFALDDDAAVIAERVRETMED